MNDTVLEVVGAKKTYGTVDALRGAGLTLAAGEWLGVLGPNGAGKTTLVRSIAGRVALDGGSIRLFGSDVEVRKNRAAQVRRRIGVVPQELALYPNLTAAENIDIFGAWHELGRSERRERAAWALEWTALSDRRNDLVRTFSGGMKRRLNIACGVLHAPQIVLLDEPTVGVDPQSRVRIWEMLQVLRDGGTALLMTTHQLDEAQQTCERLVVIDHGRDIAAGTLDELVALCGTERLGVVVTIGDGAPLSASDAADLGDAASVDGRCVRCSVSNLQTDLPQLIAALTDRGCTIEDLRVHAPTLNDVFLHLTGRELRE